ncbi:MAG: hypothetical protein ABIR06_16735 [Cyclobacteriaceae bacterium]
METVTKPFLQEPFSIIPIDGEHDFFAIMLSELPVSSHLNPIVGNKQLTGYHIELMLTSKPLKMSWLLVDGKNARQQK